MAEQQEPVHETWIHRDTYLHSRFVRPAMRFLNTEDNGIFVHERMDGFARVNDMTSYETPGDI